MTASVAAPGDISVRTVEMSSSSVLRIRSPEFSDNAVKVLESRYLLRNPSTPSIIIEKPEEMYARVARSIADVETRFDSGPRGVSESEKQFRRFYDVMSSFRFTPAGRTLANAGAKTSLVANCVVLHIEDSLDGIYQTKKDAVLLQQAGSGIGFPLHMLRPAGTVAIRTQGVASGPMSFLHAFNYDFSVIKQHNRSGANMAVMRVDHPDILEFIHCKDREGSIKNFNVSVGITDDFMNRVCGFSPDDAPWMCEFEGVKCLPRRIIRVESVFDPPLFLSAQEVEMSAREIFDEILDCAWNKGEPGCVFMDTVERSNPLPGLGRIEACNPCGEQFLHDGDVCNLGSINLEQHVRDDGTIDEEMLVETTRVAVRMLDNLIELYDFPVDRVQRASKDNRRIGLGPMGLADMFIKMGIRYGCPESLVYAEKVMKLISDTATKTSIELAAVRGAFPNWIHSLRYRSDPTSPPMRNAALTTVAPTGTISMTHDVSGGIEPYFMMAFKWNHVLEGQTITNVNRHLLAALDVIGVPKDSDIVRQIIKDGTLKNVKSKLPEWFGDVFVTAMDLSAHDHIAMQAALQKHCHNSISKTINFPFSATREDVKNGYISAWRMGCKGCTVYRDGSRDVQVLTRLRDSDADEAEEHTGASSSSSISSSPDHSVLDDDSSESFPDPLYGSSRDCPQCGAIGSVVPESGCRDCKACGWSGCSSPYPHSIRYPTMINW